MFAWYAAHRPDSRLDDLKLSMLRSASHKSPKLRSKAAEARFLVPYVCEAVNARLGDTELDRTIKAAAAELNHCYQSLSRAAFDASVLRAHSRRFSVLYVALSRQYPDKSRWKVKGKLHMFQELCEMCTSCPSLAWCYRDEDFGGALAKYARRRGGRVSPHAVGNAVILKFCALHRLPRF